MKHEINYLSESKNTYTVKVDGKEIVFSKTRNNIKYGDVAALNAFIMTVQKRAEGNDPCCTAGFSGDVNA